MLKISCAGCLYLSPAISAQFTLEMCVAVRNREKFTKAPYFFGGGRRRVQGHLRSSMLTFLRSLSPVLAMINSMSVPICNHFHAIRANSCRIITSFSSFRSWRPPSPSSIKFCHEILETLSYHTCKTSKSLLHCLVLDRYRVVTDGQNYCS